MEATNSFHLSAAVLLLLKEGDNAPVAPLGEDLHWVEAPEG